MSKCLFIVITVSITLSGVLLADNSNAQSIRNVKVFMNLKDVSLESLFSEIEKKTNFKFQYNKKEVSKSRVRLTLRAKNESVASVLNFISKETGYSFKQVNGIIAVKSSKVLRYSTPKKKILGRKITISGKIKDEKGDPLPGASVLVKGTVIGTTSDIDGNYLLSAPENAETLVFSFIGFKSQEIKIGGRSVIDVLLQSDIESLKEIVVLGYGQVEKEDLTGSVSTITSKDLAVLPPIVNIDQALQGKASGVYVVQESGQPGSAARVRIRGTTSLLGSNQPLYVIDGIPVVAESNIPNTTSAVNRDFLQAGLNSPLGNINPNDITSITILKDASAASIYGSRAANGVVIVTTKRGSDSGKPQFTANYSVTTKQALTTEVLNATQFKELWIEAVENSGSTNAFATSVLDGSYFGDADTNWENEVSPVNPVTNNFDFSVSGGNEAVKYYTSIGIRDEKGTFDNSGFKRIALNLNLDSKLSERVDFKTSLSFSNSNQSISSNLLLDRIYEYRPDIPVFEEDGSFAFSPTNSFENPVALSNTLNENQTSLFLGSIQGNLMITEGLRFKSFLSLNYNLGELSSFSPSYTFRGGFSRTTGLGNGFAQQSSSKSISHVWENTLNYDKKIADLHNINAVLGTSWQGDRSNFLEASGEGFPQDDVLTNLSSASESFLIKSGEVQSGIVSYFGRVNYGFDDRYLLTVAGRVDGSSKFAVDNKWAFFPTAAVAWRVSEESFMQNIAFLDNLKLRASAGITGQQSFGPYQWRTLFQATNYGGAPAVVQNQTGNSQLQWETSEQFDIGIDYAFFKGRLNGSVGYYEKNTKDLLYFVKTPGSSATTSVIANLGDTENKGIEIELSGFIIDKNDFSWNLSVNASRNRNRLVRLNDDFVDDRFGTIDPPNTGSVLRVGSPIGLIFGRIADGIFQTQEEIDQLNEGAPDGFYQTAGTAPGDLKFRDINGPEGVPDGEIDIYDNTVIGDTQADLFGGVTSTWTYKGISLTALFTYSIGNDLTWGTQQNGINFNSTFRAENKLVNALDRWTTENPTSQPRAVYLDPNNNSIASTYYVHDASYIRLRNINITYSIPQKILDKTKFLKAVAINFSMTNAFTITNYPGANPETNNLFDNDVSSGLDNSRFPVPKVFTGGVRIGF